MNHQNEQKDILLAEDDVDDVTIFEMALNELKIPYVLRNAKNGDVLFVLLKDQIPYILFLDIHMPCRDGLSCIIEIRKNRDYDNMPVIMYTSSLSKRILEETYRNGANLYLEKTTTFSDLVAKLKKIFSVDWTNYLPFPTFEQFLLS